MSALVHPLSGLTSTTRAEAADHRVSEQSQAFVSRAKCVEGPSRVCALYRAAQLYMRWQLQNTNFSHRECCAPSIT